MITLWMMYFLATVAASAVFVVAGRRSRQASSTHPRQDRDGLPNDPLWAEPEADLSDSSPHADAGGALRLALKRLAPVMARHCVQADVAAPLGLWVRIRGSALAELLDELLTAAIHGAPASRILLAAAPHGDRVYISVTDDMPGADANVRLASVRGLMERVALRGGVLDVKVQPAEGTTMTLRLAAASDDPHDREPTHASENTAPMMNPPAFSR